VDEETRYSGTGEEEKHFFLADPVHPHSYELVVRR
jgi:hypothetical protein